MEIGCLFNCISFPSQIRTSLSLRKSKTDSTKTSSFPSCTSKQHEVLLFCAPLVPLESAPRLDIPRDTLLLSVSLLSYREESVMGSSVRRNLRMKTLRVSETWEKHWNFYHYNNAANTTTRPPDEILIMRCCIFNRCKNYVLKISSPLNSFQQKFLSEMEKNATFIRSDVNLRRGQKNGFSLSFLITYS